MASVDEKFWIKQAIKKPGALRKSLGVSKKTGKIPTAKLRAAAKKGGKTGQRSRVAQTLKSFHEADVLNEPASTLASKRLKAGYAQAISRRMKPVGEAHALIAAVLDGADPAAVIDAIL